MRRINYLVSILVVLVSQAFACSAAGDIFGSGANTFEIPFVTIGNPGNPADTTDVPNPTGSVPYSYRIGKYEVPEEAVRKANALSAEAGDPLELTLDARGPNKPATSLSWFEAARFVNWLNTSTGHTPAYKFDDAGNFQLWEPGDAGYNPANLFRDSLARYFLPSADEWYKAAFYDPAMGGYWDYPTGSNDPPTSVPFGTAPGTAVWNRPFEQGPADVNLAGGLSPYGTMGQAGNVGE
jgi:formylglycine-generating enzyme required for sulfatase activity